MSRSESWALAVLTRRRRSQALVIARRLLDGREHVVAPGRVDGVEVAPAVWQYVVWAVTEVSEGRR